jgi:hypothetical protein
MSLKIQQVPRNDVLKLLLDYRSQFSTTKLYPFLIGDANERNRTLEAATSNLEETSKIIQIASNLSTSEWVTERKADINCDDDHTSSIVGEWPTTALNKGSTALHCTKMS